MGEEDILPSGREHNEKFSINTDTVDGVRSRAPDGGTQYTVSVYSPIHDKKLMPSGNKLPITEYSQRRTPRQLVSDITPTNK